MLEDASPALLTLILTHQNVMSVGRDILSQSYTHTAIKIANLRTITTIFITLSV